MRKAKNAARSPRYWLQRLLAAVALVVVSATVLSISVFAQNTYIITDGDVVTSCKSFSSNPDEVLQEAGISLGEDDTYTTEHSDGVNHIIINRIQMITVCCDGQRRVVGSYGETVSSLLERMDISVGEEDKLSCKPEEETYDGMTIELVRIRTERLAYDGVLSFDKVVYESGELKENEKKTLQEGQDGLIHYTALVTYADGEEISREIISETVVTPMLSEIILQSISHNTTVQNVPEPPKTSAGSSGSSGGSSSGSSGSSSGSSGGSSFATGSVTDNGTNTITTASGEVLTYTRVLTCSGTGYTCPGYTGYTYTGTVARVGAVAVDPNVIPLGSRLYIVTNDGFCIYGYCTAEDIGGAVKGNSVDLYFNTLDECYAFGRRTCTVYVLG